METRKLLLKAADIENMPGERKVHFLNPNAVRLNKSLGDAVGLSQVGVHIIYVEPGKDTTEYHKHLFEEECVYVLSGKGALLIEGDTYQLEKGDFVGFPRNTAAHVIVNDGEETLVCLVMGQRLQQDVTEYPRQDKRLYRSGNEWSLVDIQHISDPRK
ncbi:MAG TPA: cupin [Gammaproteobacteria bacterium]|nr:cupin [Gammaproteobacteria bacterium]